MAQGAIVARRNMGWTLASRNDAVVAAKTGTQHRIVVDSCNRAPVGGSVAILATVSGGNVGRIFTLGDAAVMAKHTVAGNADVVEIPVVCRMTIITLIATRHVSWILARDNGAVVAADAAADDHGMVDSWDISPGIGPVTIIAITDDPDMVTRRGACLDPSRVRMTIHAASWGADENSLQVTGFAGRQRVLEIERKVCLIVIEIRAIILC